MDLPTLLEIAPVAEKEDRRTWSETIFWFQQLCLHKGLNTTSIHFWSRLRNNCKKLMSLREQTN